jgi:hypothetical protein
MLQNVGHFFPDTEYEREDPDDENEMLEEDDQGTYE